MSEIIQNTLYLATPGTYVARDHLTLQVEVPVYPEGLAPGDRVKANATGTRKVSIPIHHLESICIFGPSTITPSALDLCWEHGVAVNFLGEHGYFQARMTGVADTSVSLRRAQFRAADNAAISTAVARHMVAGKIQNSRNSLLRGGRESEDEAGRAEIARATEGMARLITSLTEAPGLDQVRGLEGMASAHYFGVFTHLLKQQREEFTFTLRSRRPPLDRINCLLSFLYALVRHDCVAALTSIGLDPFVGFLHAERPARPSLALDLMEEFRPWLADRLALTLVNRQQIDPGDFKLREGGAVEFTDVGRKRVITAYQQRKQETLLHPLLDQTLRIGQLPFVQARILARHLRGDIPVYLPFVPK